MSAARLARRVGTFGLVSGLLWSGFGGCYRPQTVDPRSVMNELRQPGPLGSAATTAPKSSAAAGSQLPAGAALTEDRSVAVALVWNRDLRAFRLTQGIAEGEVIAVSAFANPEVRMELTHIQEGDLSKLGWDLRVTWQPPRPGVRGGAIAAAEARVDEVRHEVSKREWELACDVRTAYATLQALDEEIRVAQATIANRQRLADAVTKRMERGGTTRLDLDLVRLSLVSAEHAENQRRLSRTLAVSALGRLLGVDIPTGGTTTLSPTLADDATDVPPPARAELEDRAIAHQPAVAAALAHHRASEQTLRSETAARWPWFRFSAVPRLRRNEFIGATTDLVFGIDVSLPILDTNRGKVKAATAARDTARAEITATLSGLRMDIDRALAAVEAQQAILRRLQSQTAPLLAEHDRILNIAAQASELDLPSLIASENLVLASRIEVVTARLELRKAWIALERAVGAPLSPARAAPGAKPAAPSTSGAAMPAPAPPGSSQ